MRKPKPGDRVQERGIIDPKWIRAITGTILKGPYPSKYFPGSSYTVERDRHALINGGVIAIGVPANNVRLMPVNGKDYKLRPRHIKVLHSLSQKPTRYEVPNYLWQKSGVKPASIMGILNNLVSFGLARRSRSLRHANPSWAITREGKKEMNNFGKVQK